MTNGAFGTAVPTTDVISWDISIMNGNTTTATLTSLTGTISGTLDLSPSSITVGTNGDSIEILDESLAVISWENINGTVYGAGEPHKTLWSTGAWDAASPVASRLTLEVPEPSSAILAAIGAVAFIAYGWSRRRAQRRQGAA
jgi:hypothetical protein